MQTAVKCSILFSELKNQHKAYPQSLVFGFKISRQLGLSNLVSRNVFSTQSFSAKFGSDFNFKQNFSVTFSLIFLRKNRSEAFSGSSENILHLTSKYTLVYTTFFKFHIFYSSFFLLFSSTMISSGLLILSTAFLVKCV